MASSYFRQRAGLRARNPFRDVTSAIPGPDARGDGDPVITPTFDQPMPAMAPVIEAAPSRAVAPVLTPDPLEVARGEYMGGTPTTTKGKILQTLVTAGLGALQAAGRNPNDPVGA